MTTAAQRITSVTVFDMGECFVHLAQGGSAEILSGLGAGHPNLAGLVIGAPTMARDAPHGGECHPDGDELLYVISGCLQVSLNGSGEMATLAAGQAFVIPQNTWHRVHVVKPAHVMHVTPGPNSRTRPRNSAPAATR